MKIEQPPFFGLTPASDPTVSVPPGFNALPIGTNSDFVGINGPFYLYHEGDTVKVGFRVQKRHTNPMGICHGGMMATFCDMLLPISVNHKNSAMGHRFLPTISLQIDYIATAPMGAWVEGEADILRLTRKMAFAQALVTADDVLVARVSGIFKLGVPMPVGELPS